MTARLQAKIRKKVRDMTPGEMVSAHSEAMLTVEAIWRATHDRLCDAAGKDGLCREAVGSARARKMLHQAQAFHAEADILAAEFGALIPGGEPVIVPLDGSP